MRNPSPITEGIISSLWLFITSFHYICALVGYEAQLPPSPWSSKTPEASGSLAAVSYPGFLHWINTLLCCVSWEIRIAHSLVPEETQSSSPAFSTRPHGAQPLRAHWLLSGVPGGLTPPPAPGRQGHHPASTPGTFLSKWGSRCPCPALPHTLRLPTDRSVHPTLASWFVKPLIRKLTCL